MNESTSINTDQKFEQSLCEQRLQLILRLQLNRRLLAHKLATGNPETDFPRSMLMRFITQKSTLSIVKNITYSMLGVRTLKALYTSLSFVRFSRSKLGAHPPSVTH